MKLFLLITLCLLSGCGLFKRQPAISYQRISIDTVKASDIEKLSAYSKVPEIAIFPLADGVSYSVDILTPVSKVKPRQAGKIRALYSDSPIMNNYAEIPTGFVVTGGKKGDVNIEYYENSDRKEETTTNNFNKGLIWIVAGVIVVGGLLLFLKR